MSRGRSVRETTRTDQLGGIDHGIVGLLQAHRVLTTPQLITLTGRPERTIDYRLGRLRARSLVDRTRPYAASGSAPFFWWLTRSGARLVEGTSPAPGKGTPNPLFLRHTAAIAGLYVALLDAGPTVGLELTGWRRDEDAWEDWSNYHGAGRLRPDAYAEVRLDVDGAEGMAGAFVEVDFATMDQARLRAKVARHRRYCAETVWWDRHPGCPALLLVTTSEARVNRFLAGVERDRPRPSPYQREHPAHYDELVAACATVASPEEAVTAPVWRAAVADAPVTLAQLLSPEVRQYRRVVARVDAARRVEDDQHRLARARDLARDAEAIADAIGDPEEGRPSAMCSERCGASRPGRAGPPNIPTSSTPPPPGGPRQGPLTAPLRPLTCWPPGGPFTGTVGWPRPTCCSGQTRPSTSVIPVCAARPRRWLPASWWTTPRCSETNPSTGVPPWRAHWPSTSATDRRP